MRRDCSHYAAEAGAAPLRSIPDFAALAKRLLVFHLTITRRTANEAINERLIAVQRRCCFLNPHLPGINEVCRLRD
jgi:hypothetical protein